MSGEPVDLRLALGAVGGWLAVFFGLRWPTALLCVLGAATAVSAAVLLVFAHGWRWAAALALLLFCVAFEVLPLCARLAHARASPLALLARQHATVELTLTTRADPITLAATGVAGAPRVLVETRAESLSVGDRTVPVDGTVLVLGDAGGWRDVLPGQQARVRGSLQPDLDGNDLSVTLFSRDDPELVGRPPWWQRAAGTVRDRLRDAAAALPDQERGLLPSLVDGDTGGLDPVLAERFRVAGLSHLLVVSGTNCSLLVGAALLVLRRMRARPWACAATGGVLVLAFVLVARPSPSVLRAALMAVIALVALAAGRPRAGVPALAAAVLLLLVWQPVLAATPSFTLSVLATAALLLIAPGWAAALRRRRVPVGVAEAVAVAAAAHVVTAPVIAAISGRISVVAIPANVLAEPAVAPVTVLGFLAAALAPLWLVAASALAWTAGWPCRWLVHVADFFGALEGATVAWPGGAQGGLLLAATGLVLWFVAARAGPRRVLAAAAVTALVVVIPVRAAVSGWPPPRWAFAACDVGQGDALLLAAGPGAAVEIDAGPDPVAIDRCLHDFGIRALPLVVLTHYHLDHVAGLVGAVRGRDLGQIVSSPLGDPVLGVAMVNDIAALRGRTVRAPPAGTHLTVGAVELDVIGPVRTFRGTRSDPNNSSVVLRAEVGGVRVLLPGDAEIEAQRALVAAGVDMRADVLKIPHHGSAYFDPAFLAAVHARVAVISVGRDNDYGHPSPLLLSELDRLGVPAARTDRDGDIAVAGDAAHLTVAVRGHPGPAGRGAGRVATSPPAAVLSSANAWMASCRRAPFPSTTCPLHCRNSCCSSATRTCSSTGPSARSPPLSGGPTSPSPRRT